MQTVAKNIQRLRREAGQSQEDLAKRLHVTRQAVSNWETGRNTPDLDTLLRLAEEWGVPIEALICEAPPRPFVRGQRRYRVFSAACAGVLLLLGAAELWWMPILRSRAASHYRPWGAALAGGLLRVLAGLAAGLLLPALFSLWADLRLKSLPYRRIALAFGLGLLLAALGLTWFAPHPGWYRAGLLLPFPAGLLLFLGCNR